MPLIWLQTVGVDFCVKIVNIPNTNIAVELYLFDAAGQSIFRDLIINYVRPSMSTRLDSRGIMSHPPRTRRWVMHMPPKTFMGLQCENASAYILVYDCTNPESFQNCSHWLELVRQLRPEKPLPGTQALPSPADAGLILARCSRRDNTAVLVSKHNRSACGEQV